jgi:hypothetical protein
MLEGSAPLNNEVNNTGPAPPGEPARFCADETILPTCETFLKHAPSRLVPTRRQRRGEAHMNHSIHSADRATHLKIVVIALVTGIALTVFGVMARTNSDYAQTARVIKAGKPMAVTDSDMSMVR